MGDMVWVLLLIIFCIPFGWKYIQAKIAEEAARKEAAIEAARVAAELEWRRQNPELWKAQELVKLEKERLRMEQDRAKHERTGDYIGTAATLARFFLGGR